uniref:Uncharacterized protein n=1 Tax=Pristionchus pacificus TaxID=54126 RepID=A0A2A6BEW4_PRIPA|eukprot:PDM64422.1 hypothetical protein PRIPAC_52678 [Pristionchus pacificus]
MAKSRSQIVAQSRYRTLTLAHTCTTPPAQLARRVCARRETSARLRGALTTAHRTHTTHAAPYHTTTAPPHTRKHTQERSSETSPPAHARTPGGCHVVADARVRERSVNGRARVKRKMAADGRADADGREGTDERSGRRRRRRILEHARHDSDHTTGGWGRV